ncbi:MAG: UDP-N-acetyl glucosamine 2-epimerase [Bacteroidales bacterium]|nr:UDP-N-acetyl glucosamine 2-epimerase [Bacteroidales bacterium]
MFKNIIRAINQSTLPGIFPVHPRTRKMLDKLGVQFGPHIHLIDPVGYLDMIILEMKCKFIITDSGGVQKEAFFMKKPCITMRNQTEWVETVDYGWNKLVGTEYKNIVEAMANITFPDLYTSLYGDGNCGEKILSVLNN